MSTNGRQLTGLAAVAAFWATSAATVVGQKTEQRLSALAGVSCTAAVAWCRQADPELEHLSKTLG